MYLISLDKGAAPVKKILVYSNPKASLTLW